MFPEWSVISIVLVILLLYLILRRLLHRLRISNITSRHVLITGCDTGFGNLLARALDSQGVVVIAGCLTTDGAANLKSVTSSRLKTLILDISDEGSVANALQTVTTLLPEDAGI